MECWGIQHRTAAFWVPQVPLIVGENNLTAVASTLPGATATDATSITRMSTDATVSIAAKSSGGLAPLTVLFVYEATGFPNGASIQSVSVDYTSDGVYDYTGTLLDAVPNSITYSEPGLYTLLLHVVDTNGAVYDARRSVLVRDLGVERSMACDIYGYVRQQLAAASAQGASLAFQPKVRQEYLDFFTELGAQMAVTAQQMGVIVDGQFGPGFAEILIVRDNQDQTRNGYPVWMTQGTDGVWRISEM